MLVGPQATVQLAHALRRHCMWYHRIGLLQIYNIIFFSKMTNPASRDIITLHYRPDYFRRHYITLQA